MMTSDQALGLPDLNTESFSSEVLPWNRKVAEKLAQMNDIWPLTEDHWRVIEFVRDFYLKCGQGPAIIRISKTTGLNMHRICELFPCGMVKGAYRIAGLPRQPGCA